MLSATEGTQRPTGQQWAEAVLSAMIEPAENTIVAIGELGACSATLAGLAAEAGTEAWCTKCERDALAWLDERRPLAVLLPHQGELTARVALRLRAQSRHALTPIVSVTREFTDLTFADAFSWGADDVVRVARLPQLVKRLRALPRNESRTPPTQRGRALVVDPDNHRRLVIGRVLRNAGYGIDFAASADNAAELLIERRPELVVYEEALAPDPVALVASARDAGIGATWFFACPPRGLNALDARLTSVPGARAIDAYAPPENVLFLANEARSGAANDQRATPRVLYGTTVWFRGAGREEDDVGFSYNVSAGGLYVRTLAPAEGKLVWLELQPPRSNRRVRLVGEVVWQRRLRLDQHATTPPGFAIKLVDGARMDSSAWSQGYEAFRSDLGLGG